MGLIYFSRFVIGSERVHAILLKYPNLFSSYLLTRQLIHISSVQHQVSLNNDLGIAVPIMYTSPTTNKAVRLNVRLFMICFSNFQMKLQKARFSIGQNRISVLKFNKFLAQYQRQVPRQLAKIAETWNLIIRIQFIHARRE